MKFVLEKIQNNTATFLQYLAGVSEQETAKSGTNNIRIILLNDRLSGQWYTPFLPEKFTVFFVYNSISYEKNLNFLPSGTKVII